MRIRSSSLNSRPLRPTTQAAAAAVALMTANADIVYVDNLNVTLSSLVSDKATGLAPLVSQDIAINGTPVFTVNLQSDVNQGSPRTISIDRWQNGFVAYGPTGKGGGQVTLFEETGVTLPPASFLPAVIMDFNLATVFTFLDPGETGFIGFEFNPSGNQTLHGWIEVRMDTEFPANNSFTLTRYAYEDSGAPIRTGEIPTPGGLVFRDGLNLAAAESKGLVGVISVDIDDNGEPDFELRSNPSNNEIGFSGVNNFNYIVTGDPAGQARLFARGEEISGPITPASDPTALSTWFLGADDGDTALLGFSFSSISGEVPGWAQLERTNAGTVTLLKLAYDLDGGPIKAGLVPTAPLPVLSSEFLPDRGDGSPAFRVTVTGRDGFQYQLQRSPDLATPFANVGTPRPGTDAPLVIEDPDPLLNEGFYQVSETTASD